MSRVSPLVVALVAALAAAVAAGLTAEPRAPGFALWSEVVYREEVGLAVFTGAYVAVLLLWLAARGRVVQRVHLPGGAGFEATSEAQHATEEHAAGFRLLRREVDDLEARVAELEASLARRDGA